jgi:hypothetical protein
MDSDSLTIKTKDILLVSKKLVIKKNLNIEVPKKKLIVTDNLLATFKAFSFLNLTPNN